MPVPVPPHAKRVFQGIRHDIWQWDQTLYDGSATIFESMVRSDTVAIIPFLDAETVLLIQEEQPNRDKPFWDVPGGCIEGQDTVEETARRELEEETGYRGNAFQLLRTKRFEGMTRFEEHVVLAKGVRDEKTAHPDPGERIQVHPMPWKEAVVMCLRGELRRMEAMLAILAMEFDPDAKAIKEKFLKDL